AHAIGTMYKGEKIGALSDMTEFSFHPVKTITTGEGGAITTNSKELYIKLKMFASHGITRDKDLLLKKDLPGWYYEQQDLGYNYRMTDLQSALGSSQLKKIDTFILGRKNIVSKYNQAFAKLDEIVIQKCIKESDTSQHLYIIQLDLEKITCDRNDFYDALRAENIGVNVHYIPIYFHPYYQSLGYKKGLCPNAEYIYERIITLPLNPSMTDEDSDLVIEAVTKVLEYYRK
ncbi:MAG: DegT/DnrJ/EryC1/StrS family aminotransferase, partial [Acidaminobacteraceae bacterium]